MKLKYFALALIAAMSVTSFSACNDNKTNTNTAETNEYSNVTGNYTEITTPDTSTTGADTQEEPNELSFVRGIFENNTYTSEFADISLKIPVGMTSYTDEELAEAMGITYNTDTFEDNLNKVDSIFDLVVYNDQSESISIVYEKSNGRSVKEYIDEGLEVMTSQDDLEVDITPVEEILCAEKTYMSVTVSITISDATVQQRSFAREVNGYMLNISVISNNEDFLESFENNFIM